MNTRLAARVKATNRANAVALQIFPVLNAIFAPLVGKDILKADGSLLAKYAAMLPAFSNANGLHIHRLNSNRDYILAWEVSVSEMNGESTCCYEKTTVYIGNLTGKTLTAINDPPKLRTDYTVEEIETKRATYDAAQKVADEAKNALYPFGTRNEDR